MVTNNVDFGKENPLFSVGPVLEVILFMILCSSFAKCCKD